MYIVETLSRQLLHESGMGFHRATIFSMTHIANQHRYPGIIQTQSGQFPDAMREEVRHSSMVARIRTIEEMLTVGIVSPLSRQSHIYQKIFQSRK